jgi:putative nucleotidyltransferase with HDIG domain
MQEMSERDQLVHNPTGARVLVVDDEEEIRTVLVEHLSDAHMECVGAPGAFDAINKMKRQKFALVITDVLMPGMSGTDLLRHIKKHDPDTEVIVVSGLMDIHTAVDSLQLGAFDFITKPFDLRTIRPIVRRALEHRRLVLENRYYQQQLEKKVLERTLELNEALREIEDSYRVTLEALVASLDIREHETQAHSQRVREYALTLAARLGLEGDELLQVGRGALLHDVGKIGVPDSILLKAGPLTPAEWEEMKKHPQIGYDILRSIDFLIPAAEIVLAHQERWDGKGYPNGLEGPEIPAGARIFAVADTLDAMTSNRPYRKAQSFQAATDEIRRCSGTQFDPLVVEAFLTVDTETWTSIHESVNRIHQAQADFTALCRM